MEKLLEYYHQVLRDVNVDFQRYIYSNINWNNRMLGITGARGVGKTTLILQHIKKELNADQTLYVTAEDLYFADHKLLDLAEVFVKRGGKQLFVDEVHKYKGWSQELKLIYDYFPTLKVAFTGSSILDINKGAADLSRRAVMYKMKGLSFREYLKMFHGIEAQTFSLQQIVEHKPTIPELEHPLPLFEDYLRRGYYPFATDSDFAIRVRQIVGKTLEIDIPQYAAMNVATGRKLKQLMILIAKSVPFKINFSKVSVALGVSRNNIADYCLFIEEAGLIAQLRDAADGMRGLRKVNKIYLENTNLLYALSDEQPNIGNVRETFFFNQTAEKYETFASHISDFEIEGMTFEVGGKNKEQKQLQGVENGFVVKDNIEVGYANVIPLWHFGLTY
ncbi:MAG: AAA family ATPase [Prevotellaceae bacterium]|jgi:predicted AAA+ superfamily ATPase|nr:AAA family ATPase [Prevotellaceae bacterium]